ncbi:MAG: hypothetical protein ABW221_19665 [Vicinamibacteria bacterium]
MEADTSLRTLPPYARAGAALAGAFLVAAVAQYLGRVRAADLHTVRDVCQAAVAERWPGPGPIRFEAAQAAVAPSGAAGQRYAAQFEARDGSRAHFSCETAPADDGGWTVSRLSIVSR